LKPPLIGYRCWVADADGNLTSLVYEDCTWPVHEDMVATCYGELPTPVDEEHPAPGEACQCGIYACTRPERIMVEYPTFPLLGAIIARTYRLNTRGSRWITALSRKLKWRSPTMVAGAVLCTGVVSYGDNVIRASRARILCLTDGPAGSAPMEAERERLHRLAHCTRRYGVPAVPWDSLARYAAEFGEAATV
jgi:hypothetical protein